MADFKVFPWIKDKKVSLPGDHTIIAIGDIHGRAEELERILSFVDEEAEKGPVKLVFMGDLVDRGPRSIDCLKLVADRYLKPSHGETVWLLGNHDIMMLGSSIDGVSDLFSRCWLQNGGLKVIQQSNYLGSVTGSELGDHFREVIGADRYAAFLTRLDNLSHHRSGSLLFVHAGVNPTIDVEKFLNAPVLDDSVFYADNDDLHWSWVRYPFLDHDGEYPGLEGVIIVHGHTGEKYCLNRREMFDPEDEQIHYIQDHRLGLDGTGNPIGMVTAAQFKNGMYRIIQSPFIEV